MSGKFGTVILLLWGTSVISTWERCPVPGDTVWKKRDEPCGVNKTYHCIENRSDHIVAEGCYKEKLCLKGAYPVVEGNHIRCIICPEGSYQRIHGLRSSTYGYSYCEAHRRPCKPEYGQSLCRPGTREENRACSCNASLGFVSRLEGVDCSCFTPDDACAGCKFSKCPDESEKNDRGFCEPVNQKVSTTPSQGLVTTPPSSSTTAIATSDNKLSGGEIAVIVIVILAIIGILLLIIVVRCRKKRKKRLRDVESAKAQSQPMVPSDEKETASGQSAHAREAITVRNGDIYISAKHVVMNGQNPNIYVDHVDNAIFDGDPSPGETVLPPEPPQTPEAGPTPHPPEAAEREDDSRDEPSECSTAGPVGPSAQPPSLPSPLPPPPSPSAPPPSLPSPLPPPPSPSAPPPSLPSPLPPSPSAPPPSIPTVDHSQSEIWQPDDDRDDDDGEETQRKLPASRQWDETEVKTPLLSAHGGSSEPETTEREMCPPVMTTLRNAPVFSLCDETEVKTPLNSDLEPETAPHKGLSSGATEPEAAVWQVKKKSVFITTPVADDKDTDMNLNKKTKHALA